MILSAEITACLLVENDGEIVYRLSEEWLPRIQALEALVESKRQTYYETCEACGYFDGSPCDREDCPLNTD